MNKINLVYILITCFSLGMYGQQDAMYTHYAFNTLAVNPAYAGSRDMVTITGLHRSQWVGFEGAPNTQTITVHSPITTKGLGVGLSFINDRIGATATTSLYADLAYGLDLNADTKLSFGLKTGGSWASQDLNSIAMKEDDSKFIGRSGTFLPNIGFGLYLNKVNWYLGLSSPRLVEKKPEELNTSSIAYQRHYFLVGGLLLNLSETIKLKPTTFVKITKNAPAQLDLTGMLIFKDKFELGLMSRNLTSAGLLAGYNINNRFRVGYSFDWSFSNSTSKYNAGSHEIMLRYDIINANNESIKSPRYF